jgi:nitrate reductase gamma subunit
MNKLNKWVLFTRIYLGVSLLSLLSVSMMALFDPQSVMDLVDVQLGNTDALSSIRGVYGGVGITICLSILYLLIKHP